MQELIDEILGRANTARLSAARAREEAARLKAEASEALIEAERKDARADGYEAMAAAYQASIVDDGVCVGPSRGFQDALDDVVLGVAYGAAPAAETKSAN